MILYTGGKYNKPKEANNSANIKVSLSINRDVAEDLKLIRLFY